MGVGDTVLLDSNTIIYTGLSQHHKLRNWLRSRVVFVSAISRLEVLGYHKLKPEDQEYFEGFFERCDLFPIYPEIIDLAITLRQQKAMSVADAIIGATAELYKVPLATANISDFKHLKNLELINPLEI